MFCKRPQSDLLEQLTEQLQEIQLLRQSLVKQQSSSFDMQVDIISQQYDNDKLRSKHSAKEILIQTFKDRGLFDKYQLIKTSLKQQKQVNYVYQSILNRFRDITTQQELQKIEQLFQVAVPIALQLKVRYQKVPHVSPIPSLMKIQQLNQQIFHVKQLKANIDNQLTKSDFQAPNRLIKTMNKEINLMEDKIHRYQQIDQLQIVKTLFDKNQQNLNFKNVLSEIYSQFQGLKGIDSDSKELQLEGIFFSLQKIENKLELNIYENKIEKATTELKNLQNANNDDVLKINEALRAKYQDQLDEVDVQDVDLISPLEVLQTHNKIRLEAEQLQQKSRLQKKRLGFESKKDLIFKKQEKRVGNLQKFKKQVQSMAEITQSDAKKMLQQ